MGYGDRTVTEDQKEKLYGIIARIVTDVDRGTFEESAELETFVDELVQARPPTLLVSRLIEAASTYDSYLAKELADELKAKP